MCNVCCPGMMLCEACLTEEEEPKTVRIPRKEDSWSLPLVHPVLTRLRSYKQVRRNPPELRRSPTFVPVYEVIEPYDYPVV